MDAAAELGTNSVSKHQSQPEYGDEQADAGRDCRTRLARPNSQARTRTGSIHFPCSADHDQDWQPYPVDPTYIYNLSRIGKQYPYTVEVPIKVRLRVRLRKMIVCSNEEEFRVTSGTG